MLAHSHFCKFRTLYALRDKSRLGSLDSLLLQLTAPAQPVPAMDLTELDPCSDARLARHPSKCA